MNFIKYIMLRVTLLISVVLAVWAVIFYSTIVEEVNDETDDVLEDYSAMIIQSFLTGETMPTNDNGSNNTYYLRAVSRDSIDIVRQNEGFANESIYVKYKNEDEPARVLRQVFRDVNDNYFEVTVVTPTIDNDDLIDAIWRSLVTLFVLLLVVVVIINAYAVRSGLKPLHRFLVWLNDSDMETCELPTIKESKIQEIKELSMAIEVFARRGKKSFEEQKEFIGNASHELQTPIAICQNRLELLCESGLNEQQMDDVADCLSTLSRLAKLNKSLLMLSKIENGGFENERVSVNDTLHGHIENLEVLFLQRNISLSINERGNCFVEVNRSLISTLIVNLLKNSVAHNVDGGEVGIEIGTDFIAISNSGADAKLDDEKIFNRFYQGGTKSGTYGLGLPIVQSICKLYGFRIEYSFVDNLHCFKIFFK